MTNQRKFSKLLFTNIIKKRKFANENSEKESLPDHLFRKINLISTAPPNSYETKRDIKGKEPQTFRMFYMEILGMMCSSSNEMKKKKFNERGNGVTFKFKMS